MAEVRRPQVDWQGSLFDEPSPGGALSFDALRRDHLDERSWVDVVPGWLPDHQATFDWLVAHAPWQQRTRRMWDAEVLEPRLVASWPTGAALPAEVRALTAPLGERYGVAFDSCLVNLYRDGADAVAWHADTVRKVLRDPLVATVSLGVRRPFLLRPAAGGPVARRYAPGGGDLLVMGGACQHEASNQIPHRGPIRRYAPGGGDLLVMGGACQHEWVHSVPRAKSVVGARMSITLRHSRPARLGP